MRDPAFLAAMSPEMPTERLRSEVARHGAHLDQVQQRVSQAESRPWKSPGTVTLSGARKRRLERAAAPPTPEQAMETVRQAPAIQYEYRPEFQGDPGAAPGPQTGVRAQDLERTPAGARTVATQPNGLKRLKLGQLTLMHTAALHGMEARLARLEGKK